MTKIVRFLIPSVVMLPALCLAANKDVQNLEYEVGQLQQQVATLQHTVDQQTAALKAMTQQVLNGVGKLNTSTAVFQNNVANQLQQAQQSLAGPATSLGGKIDRVSEEVESLASSLSSVSARLEALQQKIADMETAARPAPQAAGITAESLYQNALRDESGGHDALAIQEFSDYVKSFGWTGAAADAAFQIGQIRFNEKHYTAAQSAFDDVLSNYPKSSRAPDALYMKALCLLKRGRRTEASRQLRELVRRYPWSQVAANARQRMKRIGG